jgi:cyclopropane fatty-acyl-phospholipid synthase-like methyltransferase
LDPDGHSVILGGKVSSNTSYTDLISKVCRILRDGGVRYVEMILRADHPKIVDSILKAKMIPSAVFPGLQYKDGKRLDFIVFSRSFELFDFQNLKLKGINQLYLQEYYLAWKKISLTPKMLDI